MKKYLAILFLAVIVSAMVFAQGTNDPPMVYPDKATKVQIRDFNAAMQWMVSINSTDVVTNYTWAYGDGINQTKISNVGVITMEGTAKRILNLRPDLDFSKITAQGKPTQITYGAFLGYSLPLYAADEELFFSMNTPGRWDGASDVEIHLLVALSAGEDVNDDFNLQISWEHADIGEPITNTTHDVEVETNLLTGRVEAYDTYQVDFTLDYDVDTPDILQAHDLIAMRLRRIAAAGTEIDGEVIILDYHMEFPVDKVFREP